MLIFVKVVILSFNTEFIVLTINLVNILITVTTNWFIYVLGGVMWELIF